MEKPLIKHLRNQLQKPLPGAKAQARMATHIQRVSAEHYPVPENVRPAGVLILFYQKQENWYLTLMRRTERGRHSGQVSFPGGGREEQDRQLVDTALREADEEVGIKAENVVVLGQLSQLYVPVSNSLIYPFVAYADQEPSYEIDPTEVKYVIEAPLDHLRDLEKIKYKDFKINQHIELKDVPYFDVDGNIVWGATAMVLSELLAIIDGVNSRNI